MKYWAFAFYTVIYEATIWGVFGYAVFWLDHHGAWMILAFILSVGQIPPRKFGIDIKKALDE